MLVLEYLRDSNSLRLLNNFFENIADPDLLID
jgi:hypothetical protein